MDENFNPYKTLCKISDFSYPPSGLGAEGIFNNKEKSVFYGTLGESGALDNEFHIPFHEKYCISLG